MSVTVMGDGYRRCFVRIPTPKKKWWMPKCNDSVNDDSVGVSCQQYLRL